ncbi:MAG: TonB-dependent receptor [Bacteroidales bacterium]
MKNIQKWLLIPVIICCWLNIGSVYAQRQTISIDVKNVSLEQLLNIIEKQTSYKISYRNSILDKKQDITLKMNNASVDKILNLVLPSKGLKYTIEENSIIVTKAVAKADSNSKSEKISGTVIDEDGESIIGASVFLDGTSKGTVTDINGNFNIEAPVNGSLKITFIGYSPQTVPIEGNSFIKVTLQENVRAISEVVVVGYGTQKKVNLTGSVSMITAEELDSRPISSVANGLQGLLSGVTVVNSTGQPGASSTSIRIRGLGTIGNANPLVLIDGVEGDISILNPEDVQSVSVLKDAASAAIYGARGANGVILVTTKKLNTKNQKPNISLGSYLGTQKPTSLPEMCDALEFMTLDNEARTNVGAAVAWSETQFEKVRTGSDPNYFGNTDWVSSVLNKSAPQQNYALTVNGNTGETGYMITYRYFDQSGLTVGNSTGEQRHNIRFKFDSRVIDRVNISANMGYTMRKITSPVNSLTSGGGAIYSAMRTAPNVPVYYTDGSWAYGGGNTNPVAILYDGGNKTIDADELSLMGIAKFDIVKGWDATATYSIINTNSLTNILNKTIVFTNPETPETPTYTYNSSNSIQNLDLRQRQQTLILQSNFDFAIDKHRFSGVGGFSQEWSVLRQFNATRSDLATEYNPTLNLGALETMSNDAGASQWAIRSGFGRLNYNFDDKYLLEFNYRYDLSSRFETAHRAGSFPSFSCGWRLSEEPFMKFSRNIFDNIKFRASWGQLGNQYVGSTNYPYLSVLNAVTGLSSIGTLATDAYTQTTLNNPLLTWEEIDMLDFGLDVTLLKNRLGITYDWYNKNTNKILLQKNYPSQIGATASEENAGSVNNRGWEVNISWNDKIEKVDYGFSFNLSDVKNKITSLGGTEADLSSYTIRRVGDPIGAFYGYISEGLMTPEDFDYNDSEEGYMMENVPVVVGNNYEPGDIKYRDISGPQGVPDGRISPEYDRVILGSAIPRYTYSFKGNAGYKNFDFSFSFQGIGKCNGYLTGSARHAFQDMAGYPQKVHLDRYNLVTNPNPKASYPRLTYNTSFNQSTFSTFWLEDASYLRLKNVQIGYTLPERLTQKAKIRKCRIYASGENLLTFTDFFYAYDPETPITSGGYYPQVKTFVVGLNLTFQ